MDMGANFVQIRRKRVGHFFQHRIVCIAIHLFGRQKHEGIRQDPVPPLSGIRRSCQTAQNQQACKNDGSIEGAVRGRSIMPCRVPAPSSASVDARPFRVEGLF